MADSTGHALQLLSGDAQTFLEKVWASHVHLHHADPEDLRALLSVDDVDHLLTSTALRTPALRLAKDGAVLPSSRYTRSATVAGSPLTGLVDARKVLDLFDDGATVVLQGMHRYWPPLTRLVRDLELSLGHPCQANAYFTPPGSQGFALHSDSHDVFVFQTYGSKQWEVADGTDASGARHVLLEPGVSMYLPTGTPHAARTQRSASLHVTIGINQTTWRSVLRETVDELLRDERYDVAVPAGYLDGATDFVDELRARLDELAASLPTVDAEAAVEGHTTRFLTRRNPALRGGFTDRLAVTDLDDETPLRRRPGAACVLRPSAAHLRVLLGDREMRVPLRLEAPMRFVADAEQLRPRDLGPWLEPESRLVLVRRLVREGLLQVGA